MADTGWRDRAACLGKDPALWFPEEQEEGEPHRRETPRMYKVAKRVCLGCPVQDECLEYALANREQYGMWGGHTRPERATILRDRRREVKAARKKEER